MALSKKDRVNRVIMVGFRSVSSSGVVTQDADLDYGALVEHLESSGHPIPQDGNWGRVGDVGGPFIHRKTSIRSLGVPVRLTLPPIAPGTQTRQYSGVCHVYNPTGISTAALYSANDLNEPSDSSMNALGATAISRCEPTSPLVGLGTALGELRRDGLPSVKIASLRGRNQRLRAAGQDYLNYEFAWKPFLADVRGLATAVVKSHDEIQRYRNQANKPIHRTYEFPITSSSSSDRLLANTKPAGPKISSSTWNLSGGPLDRDYSRSTRTWFSGSFLVHMPISDDQMAKVRRHYQQANHLLGIAPTPDVIWNLTPWSWLTDWFANTGDILSNVRAFAFDGLVMRYGYIMQETKSTTTYTLSGAQWVNGVVTSPQLIIERVNQKRLPATPFGFGLTWESFTPRQLAILAAIGITRDGKIAK